MLNAQRRFYTNLEKVFGRDVHFVAGRVAFGKKFSPGPGFFQDVTMGPGFFQVENTRRLRVFSERIATLGNGGGILEIGQFTPPHIFPWEWVPSRRHTSGVDEVGMLVNAPG